MVIDGHCYDVDYRHVPLDGREAAIYDRAFARGAETGALR